MTYFTKITSYILISFLIVASVFVGFGGGLHLAAAETANYGNMAISRKCKTRWAA